MACRNITPRRIKDPDFRLVMIFGFPSFPHLDLETMKSHISLAAILGAASVIAVPDHGVIELNTFCVTYLSTYLVPVSQNDSSTNDQFTPKPPFLTTMDGTVVTLTDKPPQLTTVDGTTFTLTGQPGLSMISSMH